MDQHGILLIGVHKRIEVEGIYLITEKCMLLEI